MSLVLAGGRVITPLGELDPGAVLVNDQGKIEYVGPATAALDQHAERIDVTGKVVAPGLIDIHTHGGVGFTFYVADEDLPRLHSELDRYSRWVANRGTTGFLCSIAATTADSLRRLVSAFADVLDRGVGGAEALGLHVEGPFVSQRRRGALSASWLRAPSMDEAQGLIEAGRGWIRQTTMAPELPGAMEVAQLYREAGIVVALGHSDADYETASAALRGPFGHVTHTFNAMRPFEHRDPGVVGAILDSDVVSAEVIADNVHTHPGAVALLVRCLGRERVVFMTDAMAGAGMPDGEYVIAGQKRIVREGRAYLEDGAIGGGTSTVADGVRNAHRDAGVQLPDALRMGSLNPARVIGVERRLGSLESGKDASIIVVDDDLRITLSMVKGRVVFRRP